MRPFKEVRNLMLVSGWGRRVWGRTWDKIGSNLVSVRVLEVVSLELLKQHTLVCGEEPAIRSHQGGHRQECKHCAGPACRMCHPSLPCILQQRRERQQGICCRALTLHELSSQVLLSTCDFRKGDDEPLPRMLSYVGSRSMAVNS